MLSFSDIVALPAGHVIAPSGHPLEGRTIVVQAFGIVHPDGLVLFDTGIGSEPEIDQVYRTVHRPLRESMDAAGIHVEDVTAIVNCHLHFDHAGENFRFPGVPIFAQRTERDLVQQPDYTLPRLVADFEGATFELLDGEGEIRSGLRIIPTPGHTDGHQSLLIETREGRLLLAGQAFTFATEYANAVYEHAAGFGSPPEWVAAIEKLDPQRVLFAHDLAIWDRAPLRGALTSG